MAKPAATGKRPSASEGPSLPRGEASVGSAHLTHFDAAGNAHMVEVGAKPETARSAVAGGRITMARATADAIRAGTIGKGDVLGVARIAGIQAAKRTSELIPLCHPLRLTGVDIAFEQAADHVVITATVKCFDRSGVEMEALTAVSAAALTIYDMCKAIDRGMIVEDLRLLEKRGGKSGVWTAKQRRTGVTKR